MSFLTTLKEFVARIGKPVSWRAMAIAIALTTALTVWLVAFRPMSEERVSTMMRLAATLGVAEDELLRRFTTIEARNLLLGSLTVLLAATIIVLLFYVRHVRASAEERQRAAAYHRASFDESPVAILHTAIDGTILRVNPMFCEFVGYTHAELRQSTVFDLTVPEDMAVTVQAGRALIETGRSVQYEKRYRRKDGRLVWAAVRPSLVRDRKGRPEYIVSMVQDITREKEARSRLQHQEHYDAITGLPNHALCQDRIRQAIRQSQRDLRIMAVSCISLNQFANIKASLGRQASDLLLREVSRRMQTTVRSGDTVARIGECDFIVVLLGLTTPDEAHRVLQKIGDAISAAIDIGSQEVFLSGSIGISAYPHDARSSQELIAHAETAMLRAREYGGSHIQFYTERLNTAAVERIGLEADLRRAVARDEFWIEYQPKADLTTGEIAGLEALLRWKRGGVNVGPATFIPLLEQTGLIVPVGAWMIEAVCRQIRNWRALGISVPIAVNVSAKQFGTHEFFRLVRQALHQHEVDPGLLHLELTESELAKLDEVVPALTQLRAHGVQIAVDDFGTGYSSLAYLKRLPIDALKLDRSFVSGLPASSDDVAIAKAVIAIAHALGLRVIAEGVETVDQRNFLASSGCDEYQGFLLSRPLAASGCQAFLLQANSSLQGVEAEPVGRAGLVIPLRGAA